MNISCDHNILRWPEIDVPCGFWPNRSSLVDAMIDRQTTFENRIITLENRCKLKIDFYTLLSLLILYIVLFKRLEIQKWVTVLNSTFNRVKRAHDMSGRWMRSWLVWQALLAPAIALHTVFRTRRQSPENDPVSTLQSRQQSHPMIPPPDQWFRQRFDHLRPDNRTWYQVITHYNFSVPLASSQNTQICFRWMIF